MNGLTPQQILSQCDNHRGQLIGQSQLAPPEIAGGLHDVNSKPVEVYLSSHGLIAQLYGQNVTASNTPPATGTISRDDDKYYIFVDEDGDSTIGQHLPKPLVLRLLVLHEYAHLIHGDEPHDRIDGGLPTPAEQSATEQHLMELYAHGYSHERLAAELRSKNVTGFADFLEQVKVQNGAVGPSDPSYQSRYPNLSNEPQGWNT